MPVEAKPIFRPDVIRLPILGYTLPESVIQAREKLKNWAEMVGRGDVYAHKEVEILGDFLNDVFCELLGYTRAVDDPKHYTFSREKHVQANGKFADAVLGAFAAVSKRYVEAVEGKGPKDQLDRPFGGRRVSPAINAPACHANFSHLAPSPKSPGDESNETWTLDCLEKGTVRLPV